MSAHYANRKPRTPSVMPEMAKEVIFWSAVFVVVATSAVLVGQMDADWSRPLPFSPAVALVAAEATWQPGRRARRSVQRRSPAWTGSGDRACPDLLSRAADTRVAVRNAHAFER